MKKTKTILSILMAIVILFSSTSIIVIGLDDYETGNIVQFGSYPKTEVKDEELIAKLNFLAPEWNSWISYGYYNGNDTVGSMVQGDWMRYIDISYDGQKYRGVKFTQYRPEKTHSKVTIHNIWQHANGYETNTVYWFKFEPISWIIIDKNTGLVICENIIDSQPYTNLVYGKNDILTGDETERFNYFNDSNLEVFANDYETSYIRYWLNNAFYNTAFTNQEKNNIVEKTLDNRSMASLSGETEFAVFDSISTTDKVFLPSLLEYSEFYSDLRAVQGSDYAKCQGLNSFSGNSSWLFRTANTHSAISFALYDYNGSYLYYVSSTSTGIRPMIQIKAIAESNSAEHKHTYTSTVTSPTCTEEGYTMYICTCGYYYVSDKISAKGHKDVNSDYKCDNGCGYEFEKPTPESPSKNCSCNCHKGGFMGFIWKIINFFQKLFKTNKTCLCGVSHY